MPEHFNGARPMLSSTANPGLAPIRPEISPAAEPAADSAPAVVESASEVQVLKPAPATKAVDIVKIAGLGSLVQGVRDQISGLRTELPALGQSIQDLRSSVADVKAQVDAVHDDLKFEAQTLGNGSGS